MPHYVGYHSADRMGYDASEITNPGLHTSKATAEKGDVVWIIGGDEGSPKTYCLVYWFVIDQIERPAEHEDFTLTLSGTEHAFLNPAPVLNNEAWFPAFRHRMGNFGRGLTCIDDEAVVLAAFRGFAAAANCPAPA